MTHKMNRRNWLLTKRRLWPFWVTIYAMVLILLLFCGILLITKYTVDDNYTMAIIVAEIVGIVLMLIIIYEAEKAVCDFLETHDYTLMEDKYFFKFRLYPRIMGMLEEIDENSKKQANYFLLQKQAELATMQNQIGPHFLYNTLDSIRGLAIEENAVQTTSVIGALSSMLRYSISQNGSFSTVKKELDNLCDYTNILKYRIKTPFSIEIDESFEQEGIQSYIIPKLVFQPIVENSIYHGFTKSSQNNVIRLSVQCTDVHMVISIRDNGVGMDEGVLMECNKRLLEPINGKQEYQVDCEEKSIGLVNINQRLRLLFGERYGLIVYSMKNIGTEVRLLLPIVPSEEALKFYGDQI